MGLPPGGVNPVDGQIRLPLLLDMPAQSQVDGVVVQVRHKTTAGIPAPGTLPHQQLPEVARVGVRALRRIPIPGERVLARARGLLVAQVLGVHSKDGAAQTPRQTDGTCNLRF